MTDKAAFTWPVRVYYEDTDVGGVVYYANYLRYLERARTEWLRALGIEQDQLIAEHQLLFVVTRASVDYKSPARFNDLLKVSVEVDRNMRTNLEFHQAVTRDENDGTSTVLCEASVRVACVAAGNFRPRRLPAAIVEAIA